MQDATTTEETSTDTSATESNPLAEVVEFVEYGIRSQMKERPYVTLGLGFLAGYVLGGGLSLKVGTLLLGAAGRAALASVLERAAEPSGGER